MRSCDGCTKCCEGWLHGVVENKPFYPGMPCHFKTQTGCSIYSRRPENPCKKFMCEWLVNDFFPEWFKPDLINFMVTKEKINNIEYYHFRYAGDKMPSEVLNWIHLNMVSKRMNVIYSIGELGVNYFGSDEFVKSMNAKYNN